MAEKSENWEKIKKKKVLNKLWKLHDNLIDNKIEISSTSDTGTIEEGFVVFTISCKKGKLNKKIKELMKEHGKKL